MLFMGEEYGATTPWPFFTSHPEPELGKATAEGRLREFERMGWDPNAVPNPQDPATFESAKLDWAESEKPEHRQLLDTYRELIRLRATEPDLNTGDFRSIEVEFDEAARWLLLRRGRTAVLLNFGAGECEVPLAADGAQVLLSTVDGVRTGTDMVTLPGHASLILSLATG